MDELVDAVRRDGGAVYLREVDANGRPLGFVAAGDGRADAPSLPFDSQGGIGLSPRT